MTRTYCVGEPPDELLDFHRLCAESLAIAVDAIRPGMTGAHLHRLSCRPFEQAGYPTALSKPPGAVLTEGFFHSLGHGVGLEVHEAPFLGRGGPALVPGDVIAVEPGCYDPALGGCRLEDLVLVTENGCEVLTEYPYDLAP
jgi:Xaa-Pro aminopeptidase